MPTAYAERMRSLVSPAPVWQVVPSAPEHIRELLNEPGGLAAAAGSHPGFTDHGGSTLKTPRLVLIDFGQWWGDTARRNQFAKEVMEYGYLSGLANYGSGNGTFWGTVAGPAFSGDISDQQVQDGIKALIAAGTVPTPDGNTLYMACLPDGVNVLDPQTGQPGNCNSYCGYHSAIDSVTFYGVLPSALCQPCHGNIEPFNAFCMVLGHEVAEACTDAMPGQGWFVDDKSDSMDGAENGDLEAWIPLQWGPWVVQGYYTNEHGNTRGAYIVPPVVQLPKPTATALVLAGSPSDPAGVRFNVTVVGHQLSGPTGAVDLLDGTTVAMTGQLGQGATGFGIPLSPGGHRMTASYRGDPLNQPSMSPPLSVTVPQPAPQPTPDYSLLDPLIAWVIKNYRAAFIDVFEKIDPAPADVAIFEEWRAAGKTWGFW